eukprot:TRINITY_DN17665_c0_g1_i1.p1 TRINITY_DN17665_c0_g1~~TRINITY_DN17665_c0_g1_i1.p1  ORF type:complete len:954 (+),score=280.07 TRINITY_DN17665_c0_g1_i1:80-2941(+)
MPNAALLTATLDWRSGVARRVKSLPDAIVAGDAIETLSRRCPLHPWGVFECVGEASFVQFGGELLRLCRAHRGWVCDEETTAEDAKQLVSVLKNAQIIRQLRRTGVSVGELAGIFKAPEQTMRKLASPWVIGMHRCPEHLIPWGPAKRAADGASVSPTTEKLALSESPEAERLPPTETTTEDGLTSTTGNSPARDSRQSLCSSASSEAALRSDAADGKGGALAALDVHPAKEHARRDSYAAAEHSPLAAGGARRASASCHLTNTGPAAHDDRASEAPSKAKKKQKPLTLAAGLYWTALPEAVLQELEDAQIPHRRASRAKSGSPHSLQPSAASPRPSQSSEVPERVSELSPTSLGGRRESLLRRAARSFTPPTCDKLFMSDELPPRNLSSARHAAPRPRPDAREAPTHVRRFRTSDAEHAHAATPSPHPLPRRTSFSKNSAPAKQALKRRGTAPDARPVHPEERRVLSPGYAQHTQSTGAKVAPLDLSARRMSTGRIPTSARVPSQSQPLLTNRRSSALSSARSMYVTPRSARVSDSPMPSARGGLASARSRSGGAQARTRSSSNGRRGSLPTGLQAKTPSMKSLKRGVPTASKAPPATAPHGHGTRRHSGRVVSRSNHSKPHVPPQPHVATATPAPMSFDESFDSDVLAVSPEKTSPSAAKPKKTPPPSPKAEKASHPPQKAPPSPKAAKEPAPKPGKAAGEPQLLSPGWRPAATGGRPPQAVELPKFLRDPSREKEGVWSVADAVLLLGRERTPSVETCDAVSEPSPLPPAPVERDASPPRRASLCNVSPAPQALQPRTPEDVAASPKGDVDADADAKDYELSPPSCDGTPRAPSARCSHEEDFALEASPQEASPSPLGEERRQSAPTLFAPPALATAPEAEEDAGDDMSPGKKLEASFARFMAKTASIRDDCDSKLPSSLRRDSAPLTERAAPRSDPARRNSSPAAPTAP